MAAVGTLGYPAAIFPGDEKARAGIDSSIAQLEQNSPTPSPLQQPDRGGQPAAAVVGDWKLVYASSGTYVTRTAAAQALLAASRLPGVGVADIRQSLQELTGGRGSSSSGSSSSGAGSSSSGNAGDDGSGSGKGRDATAAAAASSAQLRTSSAACFGLGPLGDWEVVINGSWDVQNATLARVTFDGFSLQLVGLLGAIKLPSMAKVSIPVPNGRSADFCTTYLSDDLRVARGSSNNIFLFERLP